MGYTTDRLVLMSGTAHKELAQSISAELGIPVANAHIGRFPDGEIDIKVYDDIRGGDVFVIQPTCPPVNENWIELLLIIDTLRREVSPLLSDDVPARTRAASRSAPRSSPTRSPAWEPTAC